MARDSGATAQPNPKSERLASAYKKIETFKEYAERDMKSLASERVPYQAALLATIIGFYKSEVERCKADLESQAGNKELSSISNNRIILAQKEIERLSAMLNDLKKRYHEKFQELNDDDRKSMEAAVSKIIMRLRASCKTEEEFKSAIKNTKTDMEELIIDSAKRNKLGMVTGVAENCASKVGPKSDIIGNACYILLGKKIREAMEAAEAKEAAAKEAAAKEAAAKEAEARARVDAFQKAAKEAKELFENKVPILAAQELPQIAIDAAKINKPFGDMKKKEADEARSRLAKAMPEIRKKLTDKLPSSIAVSFSRPPSEKLIPAGIQGARMAGWMCDKALREAASKCEGTSIKEMQYSFIEAYNSKQQQIVQALASAIGEVRQGNDPEKVVDSAIKSLKAQGAAAARVDSSMGAVGGRSK